MMERRCKINGACSRLYMPLAVSFGKNIHRSQGANVGKTQPGRPDNAYYRLAGDPGTRNFEANNPGLFYTLLSRATTLGEEGKPETSAIFFKGVNMIPQRIDKITCKQGKEGGIYKKIEEMRNWVAYLTKHTMPRTKDEDIDEMISWAEAAANNTINKKDLTR